MIDYSVKLIDYWGPKPGVGGTFPHYDPDQPGTKALYKQIGYWKIIDFWQDPRPGRLGYEYVCVCRYHVGEG